MSNQNSKSRTDDAEIFTFSDVDELKDRLIKSDNEASPTISKDGKVIIYTIPVTLRKRIPPGEIRYNKSSVAKFLISFWEGDRVTTKDGRKGIVLGNNWLTKLVLYDELNQPRSGYYLVEVEIDGNVELHLRNNLSGERIVPLGYF